MCNSRDSVIAQRETCTPKVGIDLLVLYTLRLCKRALRGDVDVGIFLVNILDPLRDNVVMAGVFED